jgi:nucleoside-diphosphate-sugar epimerase
MAAVAVTGATGFIGRYLVRAVLARGDQAIAVVRSAEKAKQLAAWGATIRVADLADAPALTRAFEGCEAVLANAGMISLGQYGKQQLLEVNAKGVENALNAAKQAGVRRVVLTSSVSAYRKKRGGFYTENDPLLDATSKVSRFGWYGLSKALGEAQAWKSCAELGLQLTVVRPGSVYGAWDETGFTSWFLRLLGNPLITILPTHLYIPNVYAGDLAQAVVSALKTPVSIGKAYNLAGDPSVSFWQLLRAYRQAGGRVPWLTLPFPVPLRYGYDIGAAQRDLGFSNRPPHEAFGDTLQLTA